MAIRTFGKIRYLHDGNVWIFDKVEPHVMIRLKSLFRKIRRGESCPLKYPHDQNEAIDLDWFLSRYPMLISDDDLKFLRSEKDIYLNKLEKVEAFFRPDYVPSEIILKKPLRKYQHQFVDMYMGVKRMVLGDVVGLGKTISALATFNQSTLPAAVFVQTHLTFQWKEKIEEFTELKVHLVKNGPVYQLPAADVYVFKYSQAAKWIDILVSGIFKSAVFDEIQELRKSESQKTIACNSFSKTVEYVLGLSATPLYNWADELWNIFSLIKPGCLGNLTEFSREWCKDNGYQVADPKALGSYLREQHLFLRRTRDEVGMELPEVNKIVHVVDYDSEAIDKIEDVARTLALKVMQGSFVERGQASRDLDIMVRQATGVSKAKYVAEYVKMLVNSGESVLLAGWHREFWNICLKEFNGLNPVMYTGTESPAEKEESRRKFMSGESKIMGISLRSGVGLDGLQLAASIVVIGELDWSPQVNEQIIGRLNRDGQRERVTVVFLVSNSGSDPVIMDMLGLKASLSSGVLDPMLGVASIHSDESRIQKLAKQYVDKIVKNVDVES